MSLLALHLLTLNCAVSSKQPETQALCQDQDSC